MDLKRIIRNITLLGFWGLGTVACDDFLTIYPTNDIVLEDYWKEKADVDAMVATVYKGLLGDGCMERMIIWGELRSDNMVIGEIKAGEDDYLKRVAENNMYPSNSINGWSDFYWIINNCNTVLKYAPEVQLADPDFSRGDLNVIESEMLTIRALCYFYLARAFHAIPMNLEAVMDDVDITSSPQVSQDSVFTQIIKDLDEAEYKAIISGSYLKPEQNKGFITLDAVHALRADVYLWMASVLGKEEGYALCIADCDRVIDAKEKYYNKQITENTSGISGTDLLANASENIYPLAANEVGSTRGAYYNIFGLKNAGESIFELQYKGQNENVNNKSYLFYGSTETQIGKLAPASFLSESYANDASDLSNALFAKTDVRRYDNIQTITNGVYGITKYATRLCESVNSTTTGAITSAIYSFRAGKDQNDANWIVYRLSDVMLMKAEALVQLKDETKLRPAFDLVRAVWERSNPSALEKNDTLAFETYRDNMEEFVMAERQRELMFEGKRWYDLMRYAYRKGSARTMVRTFLLKKYIDNQAAVLSKLSSLNSLYYPIFKGEMDKNENLEQNPEYVNSSSTERD